MDRPACEQPVSLVAAERTETPQDALRRFLTQFCAYCELSADLDEVLDADAIDEALADGETPAHMAAEFVAAQAERLRTILLRPLWGRGARGFRRAEAFLWEDPTVAQLAADNAEYGALRELLTAEERTRHDAALARNAERTPLTKRVWFDILTLGIPLFCKWFYAKCRPTAQTIVGSELFSQWLRLERCRRLAVAVL